MNLVIKLSVLRHLFIVERMIIITFDDFNIGTSKKRV